MRFVCRCEEVTEEEIVRLAKEGYSLEEIKRMTRMGMGLCQGRTCLRIAARIIAGIQGKDLSEIKLPTSRQPVVPVELGKLNEAFVKSKDE